jgi:CrcB protein
VGHGHPRRDAADQRERLTAARRAHRPSTVRTIAGTGFCGGYTTFSTASFETVRLLQQGRGGLATVYGVGTLGVTVLAAAAGLLLTYLL